MKVVHASQFPPPGASGPHPTVIVSALRTLQMISPLTCIRASALLTTTLTVLALSLGKSDGTQTSKESIVRVGNRDAFSEKLVG
jgi:hypothetical protein